MDPLTRSIVLAFINAAISIWQSRMSKPPGWRPTAEEWQELAKLPTLEEIKAKGRATSTRADTE
jgi:hypothetical protein